MILFFQPMPSSDDEKKERIEKKKRPVDGKSYNGSY